jgi:hypothetical protein
MSVNEWVCGRRRSEIRLSESCGKIWTKPFRGLQDVNVGTRIAGPLHTSSFSPLNILDLFFWRGLYMNEFSVDGDRAQVP